MTVQERKRRRRRPQKPPNGQANSGTYLLVFDLSDDAQARAWEVAQELAAQRRLKHVLVALLLAIHTVQTQTGKAIDMLQFMASFITGLVSGRGGYVSITDATDPEELPTMFAGTADHDDPLATRENFAVGMGDLFSDEEDVWD